MKVSLSLIGLASLWLALPRCALPAQPRVVLPRDASQLEALAGREVQRYVYLRTGRLLPLRVTDRLGSGDAIVVARQDRSGLLNGLGPTAEGAVVTDLAPQEYLIASFGPGRAGRGLLITGGDDVGTLYGAYRFAERLGARFQLDGDVLPDERIPLVLAGLHERQKPLFALRGLLPFHDFPEGPDWWTLDEWKSILSQAAKLRLNFVGLHTYPKGALGPEPTVWIGLPQDCNPDGTVRLSDATSWHNTQRFTDYGCYRPEKTGAFSFGGAALFESDDYGPEVNGPEDFPFPQTPEASVALMNRTGAMLREVFTFARQLGFKTCVGTEGPLSVPDVVKDRLQALNLDPADPATVQQLYTGMFQRIQRTYPIDYYWIWGHEGEINATNFLADYQGALRAAETVRPSFGLGLCGWGWITENFPTLDARLPTNVVFSAINLSVGNAPVSTNFARLTGRPRWAIPWFEDDPALIVPQLWVGRMRQDALDARTYGCTGLMGLHWRTRALGPNIVALAQAAWDQAGWSDYAAEAEAARSPRFRPTADFYQDWARAQFGPEASTSIARIFEDLDGRAPRPCDWDRGPGVITVNPQPWEKVEPSYRFVETLAGLRPQVRGRANLERFDWWLETFRYTRAMARLGCARGALDRLMARIEAEPDGQARRRLAQEEALPARLELVALLADLYAHLFATLHNSSELGTLVNLEQQALLRTQLLTRHDARLEALLGEPLPAAAQPWKDYRGPDRIVLPTRPGCLAAGEPLELKAFLLTAQKPAGAWLHWRSLGQGAFRRTPLVHAGRSVYRVNLSRPAGDDTLEYYVSARTASGRTIVYPTSAPALNLTAVSTP